MDLVFQGAKKAKQEVDPSKLKLDPAGDVFDHYNRLMAANPLPQGVQGVVPHRLVQQPRQRPQQHNVNNQEE